MLQVPSISCAIENYCNKHGFITEQKGAYDLVTDIDKGIEDFLKKAHNRILNGGF